MTVPPSESVRPGHPQGAVPGVEHAPGMPEVPSGRSARRTFKPRWDRAGVAVVGLLALVAALMTFVLGAFGQVSLAIPLASLVVAGAAVVVLRFLAVRTSRDRINRAFAEAMGPVGGSAPKNEREHGPEIVLAGRAVRRRPTALFDAEQTVARPLTAMELRTAALAVAHGSSIVDLDGGTPGMSEAPTGEASAAGSTAWAPVEVPKPTYVDAAKAERRVPAPLDLPDAPRSLARTPIKALEAAARAAEAEGDAETPAAASSLTTTATTTTPTTKPTTTTVTAPATGRINLDVVLQRRRA